MKDLIRSTVPVGFAFGVFFALIAYVGGVDIPPLFLWLLPLFTTILCVLGGAVATVVVNILQSRFSLGSRTATLLAFIAAALFNLVVVLLIGYAYGSPVMNPKMALGVIPGLALGAAYAFYQYNLDTLNERAEFFKALAEKNKQLQDASRRLAITEERNRMGRELHDSVSQGLHGLVFAMHSLRNSLREPSEQVLSILNHMEATANSTLDELRTMIEELRPSVLAEQGLENALRTAGELFSQNHNLPLHFTFSVESHLAPEVEMAIYRITQEALSNIGRHSGAEHVHLKLTTHKHLLQLTISDDGVGFDSTSAKLGNGLNNMRLRAEEAGGVLKVNSRKGLGTTISAEFPNKG